MEERKGWKKWWDSSNTEYCLEYLENYSILATQDPFDFSQLSESIGEEE